MTYCWAVDGESTCLLDDGHDGEHERIPLSRIGATLASRMPETEPDPAHEAALAHARRIDCCGNDEWRGHLCQYHQGFEDGWDVARGTQ